MFLVDNMQKKLMLLIKRKIHFYQNRKEKNITTPMFFGLYVQYFFKELFFR